MVARVVTPPKHQRKPTPSGLIEHKFATVEPNESFHPNRPEKHSDLGHYLQASADLQDLAICREVV